MAKRLLILIFMSLGFHAYANGPEHSDHISSPEVNAFAEDDKGFVWIATANGLNRFNGSTYTVYHAQDGLYNLDVDNILSMFCDTDGSLWLGTECGIRVLRDGILYRDRWSEAVYNPVTYMINLDEDFFCAVGKAGFARFRKSDLEYQGSYFVNGVSFVEKIFYSRSREIWFTHESNDSTYLRTIDKNMNEIFRFHLGNEVEVHAISEMNDGSMLLATENGLRRFLGKEEIPVPSSLDKLVAGSKVLFMREHMEGILLGLSERGVFWWNPKTRASERIIKDQILDEDEYICFVDSRNTIYISDRKNGFIMCPEKPKYTFHALSDESDTVSDMYFDGDGNLWASVGGHLTGFDLKTGRVFYKGKEDIVALNMNSSGELVVAEDDRISVYGLNGGRPVLRQSMTSANISEIAIDRQDRIWVSHSSYMDRLTKEGKWEPVESPRFFNYAISDPVTRRLFIHTISRGIYEVDEGGEYIHLPHWDVTDISEVDKPHYTAGVSNVNCMCVAPDGSLWLGTYNFGLLHYDPVTGETESYYRNVGLVDGNIRSIICDRKGNVWFTTNTHIVRYDPVQKVFDTMYDRHYRDGRIYDRMSAAMDSDGMLYFGGSGHVTVVDPSVEFERNVEIPLHFESITVNGEVRHNDVEELDLGWRQNILSLRFVGLDFRLGTMLNYEYMLEGYDPDWQYVADGSRVTFNYLPAGRYVFKARVREQGGQWSPYEIALPVTVRPAPWFSWWAKTIYVLLAAIALLGVFQLIIRFRMQKERVLLAENREEMKQEQIDFFTNISHEFRTPLSMIYGPAKQLGNHDLDREAKELVDSIVRNAERLQNLSEQVLDSNPENHRDGKLQVRNDDIVSVVRTVMENLRFAALEKSQTLNLSSPDTMEGWLDSDKITKIFSNLLSNAIKYTPYGRNIEVFLFCDRGGQAIISVSDDGLGIEEEMRDRIFKRFDRLGSEDGDVSGSGVGLNYSYNLALLHKGSLTYQPKDTGGSVFSLAFPTSKDAYETAEIDETPRTPSYIPVSLNVDNDAAQKQGTVLVVEDTAELRSYLQKLLSSCYQVVTASDGLEAIDSMKLGLPDIVISDILMPGMNGYELCNEIKNNPDWNHIPVILLTAKADAMSSIQGYKAGADSYIPKPFDPEYLMAVIESQLRNRRILQQKVLNLTSNSAVEASEIMDDAQLAPRDRFLLEKIHTIMEKNLSNERFGVEDMAQALDMSYSSLYAKMKAMTGKTPLFYINNYRMNKAKELLESKMCSVSEVAFKVGSLSPNTFSRDFKKYFGITPSSLLK